MASIQLIRKKNTYRCNDPLVELGNVHFIRFNGTNEYIVLTNYDFLDSLSSLTASDVFAGARAAAVGDAEAADVVDGEEALAAISADPAPLVVVAAVVAVVAGTVVAVVVAVVLAEGVGVLLAFAAAEP